jgi:capsular exopolysaccharide synthesis family protein
VELREYVRACRRRWLWIVLPVLIAAGAAAGLTLTAAPAYRSSTVLFVTTSSTDPDATASRLNSYIALITGPRVAQNVADKLGNGVTADQVQKNLTAQVQAGTDLLVVSAVDPDQGTSRAMVTAASSTLVTLAAELDPPATATQQGNPTPKVSIAQQPVTTRDPGNLVRNIGFSAVLGLLIGAAAVAVREATARTAADEDDLRRLGLPAVGTIALGGRSGRGHHPDEALAEAFRRLRSLLPDVAALSRTNARGTSLVLTASGPKEGTTAIACGLAVAVAETGARVVLIDANLRSPGVGRYLALDGGPGLADVLTGDIGLPEALRETLDGRITVLPPGKGRLDPGELLASPALLSTLRYLTERYDAVIVDAPSLHGVADAVVLSKVADGALLVVRANKTRTGEVERSKDLLERVGARLVGAVLNALPKKLPASTGASHAEPGDSLSVVTHLIEKQDDEEPPVGKVRGRAHVVNSEVVPQNGADEQDKKDEKND